MALTIEAGFGSDLVELAEDLEAVEEGLSRLLDDIISREVQPVLVEMRGLLPHDPTHRGWRRSTRRRDPGHIRDSLKAELVRRRGLVVRTTHPGGPVHWWGGAIAPRGHEIAIRKHSQAGEDFTSRKADEVGERLDAAVDRLMARLGF